MKNKHQSRQIYVFVNLLIKDYVHNITLENLFWYNLLFYKKEFKTIYNDSVSKGPSKVYVTARGGRGSTILLHVVTYILRGRGSFMK